ncbi:MAG: hypothetical protein J7M18_05445 [Candidatus Eremiobacteraeota bacterium]|nr:hypothetical protein [Candidatus Eremiobacteraeota bacterium]
MNEKLAKIKKIADFLTPAKKGKSAETITHLFEVFPGEFSSFCEFSITPGKKRLGLLIQGQGKNFIERVKKFTKKLDIALPGYFTSYLARKYLDIGLLFKIDLFFRKSPGASIYLRKEVGAGQFKEFAESAGVKYNENLLSKALKVMRRYGGFPFIDLTHNRVPETGVVISANLGEGDILLSCHLLDLFELLSWKVPGKVLEWNRQLISEYNREIFCSIELSGQNPSRIKIDYPGVRWKIVKNLLCSWGTKMAHVNYLDDVLTRLNKVRLDYFGMIISSAENPAGKLYIQEKSRDDSIENFVRELKYMRFRSFLDF